MFTHLLSVSLILGGFATLAVPLTLWLWVRSLANQSKHRHVGSGAIGVGLLALLSLALIPLGLIALGTGVVSFYGLPGS